MSDRQVEAGSKPATSEHKGPAQANGSASSPAQSPVKAPEAKAEVKAEAKKAEAKKADAAPAAKAVTAKRAPAKKAQPARAAAAKTRKSPAKTPARRVKKAQPAKAPAATKRAQAKVRAATQEGTKIMNKQTTEALNTGKFAADRVQAVIGDVNARTKTAMEKGSRAVEEMTDLTRGNVEALVASSKIVARGVETLGHEAADYGRRSFEEASAALKSFAEIKSPTDFFRLQGEYARSTFDAMVTESSKMSEAVLKLAGEVAQPITSRYSVAAERAKKIAA